MTTVTIPKSEYKKLVEAKLRWEYVQAVLAGKMFSPPPTRNTKEVVRAFERTKKYSEQFLASLERGLKRSSHFRA